MATWVFPDNTVLCNFAAVSRLDLLKDWLRGRGRWCEAVAFEARVVQRPSTLPWPASFTTAGWVHRSSSITMPQSRSTAFGGSCSAVTPRNR